MTIRSFKFVGFATLIVIGLNGCKPVERDRCTVEGTATLGGKPLSGFGIALFSDETGGGGGMVQDDGSFQIAGPIQESEYTISFVIPAETKGAAREKLEAMNLPAKYRRSQTSDYKVTLVPGNNVLTIDLKQPVAGSP